MRKKWKFLNFSFFKARLAFHHVGPPNIDVLNFETPTAYSITARAKTVTCYKSTTDNTSNYSQQPKSTQTAPNFRCFLE